MERNKGQKRRQFLIKRYGPLYKRVIGFDLSKCAYCSFPRQALDHVPAISLLDGIDVPQYIKSGGKFLLYPVCTQCNNYLRNKGYTSYIDRLDFLAKKYLDKMRNTEIWSPHELSQLTGTLKAYIQANQFKIRTLVQKQENIEENILKHQYDDLA